MALADHRRRRLSSGRFVVSELDFLFESFAGLDLVYILFKAFQIPGCVKEIRPTKMTLNKGVRYHLANLDRGLVVPS